MTKNKIDCSFTVNYLREKYRMSKGCEISCYECPMTDWSDEIQCAQIEGLTPEKAVGIVQNWSNNNPYAPKNIRTYKDDFFENYPDAKAINGYPVITCACLLYPEIMRLHKDDCAKGCHSCWDMKKECEEDDNN